MNNSNKTITFEDLLDHLVREDNYVFPYEKYNITGDTAEIDRIINKYGIINIEPDDVFSTLSESSENYITVGQGEGEDCVAGALNDAFSNLPIATDEISRLLVYFWLPRTIAMDSFKNLVCALMEEFARYIYVVWGCDCDESERERQVKVSLIAARK